MIFTDYSTARYIRSTRGTSIAPAERVEVVVIRRAHHGDMTFESRRPDGLARAISHVAVGGLAAAAVGYIVGKKATPATKIVSGLVAVGLHGWLDAPVARVLTEEGL